MEMIGRAFHRVARSPFLSGRGAGKAFQEGVGHHHIRDAAPWAGSMQGPAWR